MIRTLEIRKAIAEGLHPETAIGGMTDAEHSIRLDWQATENSTINNGSLSLWVDGELMDVKSGVDNDTHELDYFMAGAVGGVDASTSGTFYMDSFETRSYDQQVLYDAQGNRTINKLSGETVVYIGSYYELNVSTNTEKSYYSGFAMRQHDLADGDRIPKMLYTGS